MTKLTIRRKYGTQTNKSISINKPTPLLPLIKYPRNAQMLPAYTTRNQEDNNAKIHLNKSPFAEQPTSPTIYKSPNKTQSQCNYETTRQKDNIIYPNQITHTKTSQSPPSRGNSNTHQIGAEQTDTRNYCSPHKREQKAPRVKE